MKDNCVSGQYIFDVKKGVSIGGGWRTSSLNVG